jgi:hypothetical protein
LKARDHHENYSDICKIFLRKAIYAILILAGLSSTFLCYGRWIRGANMIIFVALFFSLLSSCQAAKQEICSVEIEKEGSFEEEKEPEHHYSRPKVVQLQSKNKNR